MKTLATCLIALCLIIGCGDNGNNDPVSPTEPDPETLVWDEGEWDNSKWE